MRWNGFGRSILFAVLVAVASLVWCVIARPVLGPAATISTVLIAAVATYLTGLVPETRRRVATFVVAAVAGSVAAAVSRSGTELVIALAVILAVGRSGVLFRASGARAIVIEAALVVGGLLFARFLAGPLPNGLALSLWGFFLVQSLYFLIGGVRIRGRFAARRDPFEEALARANGLLGRTGI